MNIQYASDLHLEFAENSRYLKEFPLQVTGDILVLAGDIFHLGKDCARHPFWEWAADNYQQVIVVAGNHQFYDGFDLDTLHDGWTYKIRPNVAYHYNDAIRIGDTDLILTTLWSAIRIEDAFATLAGINDFRRIRCGNKALDWVRFNEEHHRCFIFSMIVLKAARQSTSWLQRITFPASSCCRRNSRGATSMGLSPWN